MAYGSTRIIVQCGLRCKAILAPGKSGYSSAYPRLHNVGHPPVVQNASSHPKSLTQSSLALAAMLLLQHSVVAVESHEQFFETEVRPLLVEKCADCHGNNEVSGGLRVDSRNALIKGGDSGSAIIPGDVSESLLIQAVRRTGEMPMPPEEELSKHEVDVLQRWIELGAPWPDSSNRGLDASDIANQHWAFQSIDRPSIPSVTDQPWVRTPIDSFVMAKLEENQLDASPVADRRSLIRRVTYSLTGLPPTQVDVEQFVANPDPDAYANLVERLLESPQYGEHWARHWLDVARYSDTKGYVYAREERFWVHAWTYRDWVTQSLNDDMPYDRFLLLQMAADQVDDRREGDLAAMGFLTLGRRFLGVRRDIIDDRIDVVSRGTMGLTVACARCHNHKYDPIPTADYYSLYGVFDSCVEQLVPLATRNSDEAFEQELAARKAKLQNKLIDHRKTSSDRARDRVADYLFAQSELDKYPANGFDQIFSQDDLLPAFVRRWEQFLRKANKNRDPRFTAWHRFAQLPPETFADQSSDVTNSLLAASDDQVRPIVRQAFSQPPQSFREVCDRYGEIFADAKKQWEVAIAKANQAGTELPDRLTDANLEEFRDVLYGPQSPSQVPDGPIVQIETLVDSATCTELWKLQGEVDRWIIESDKQTPHAVTLVDQGVPAEPRVFRRGNPLNLGNDVPRQFLSLLAGEVQQPFRHGSGRLELAQAIIDPENPLTARVIVNRVWAHHFGQGLVSTPSDFGTRAAPPSHPELLDWLATEFVSDGWSLKNLHRQIVLSAAFRQSNSGPTNPDIVARAMETDPNNRLLWRRNSRRMSFEELRDSLLSTTGELDKSIGGKPADLFQDPYPKRRTLYGLVDRQYFPGTLRMFDFANPDLHTPKRNETTVPQQALFLMNHPLVLERAKALAQIAKGDDDPSQRVATMFRQVLQRDPTGDEIADAVALVNSVTPQHNPAPAVTTADWQYGYGALDESHGQVTGFTPLPHFTGAAWQGGARWPDQELGWVQLTAAGGHPGNDRDHAAVRRWIAPRDMEIRIQSELKQESTQGDGIRAFVIHSKGGVLLSKSLHHDTAELNVASLTVLKGQTIDFLVDIGDVLNSDQYLWSTTIQATESNDTTIWNSADDFPKETTAQLAPWEQLAQVLLCTNEFLFVD